MTKVKRLVAVVLALMMILGSVSVASYAEGSAWDATTSDGFALDVTTKIFRMVDGKWTETDKVKAGETVKARVYLGTDYFTSGGQLVFFYNNDFFSDSYTKDKQTLAVNPAFYAGGNYGIKGYFYGSKSSVNIESRLIAQGVIDSDFADAHNFMAVSFDLAADKKNNLLVSDQWFCEFDLIVNEDAPANDEGDFFILAESFRDSTNKARYSNISKGPSFGYNENVVDMSNWEADITVDSYPVDLYTNYVEATFNASEGAFADGRTTIVIGGEAGEAIAVETPVREEYTFEGWAVEGSTDTANVAVLPAVDTVYVAQWKSSTDNYGETLKFKTDIYRQNDNGEWVYTEKVIPGETVKARIYIDTTYATNAGDVLVFFDNDFFEDANPNFTEGSFTDLVVNKTEGSAAELDASGTYVHISSTSRFIKRMVNAGLITQDFVDTHTAYTFTYKFNPAESKALSGEYYFAEWTLKVKDSATGEGDFFVVENTIYNTSETGKKAYINVPVGEEGGSDNDAVSLYEINVSTEVESHPVTTVSSINFDANGGEFANGETTFVIEGDIADSVDAALVPEVALDGNTFKGWVPADIANPTVDDVVEIPSEIPFDDLYLKALWINEVTITIDLANGEPVIEKVVTAGDAFEKPEVTVEDGKYLAGWLDGKGNYYAELPDVYPTEDTTYTALFETYTYNVEYFVLNPETLNYERVSVVSTAYGDVINAVPNGYVAPDGYTLSAAYKDTTFAADTALAAGETMPANNVKLYYKLVANKYPATFKLDGGNINGNTADVVVETVYGQQIKAPANPVKEGYTFTGWSPMVGMMDTEAQEFIATWEANTYYVTYIVEGEEYEVYDVPFGLDVEMPLDPVLPGYNFVGWDAEIPATMPAGDLTFTAVFEEKDIAITLELDGGKYNGSEDAIVIAGKYGDDITAPEADKLEKEGYVFGGWEPALPETLPTENVTYTAIWKPAKDTPYTVEVYYQDTEGNHATTPDEVITMTGETDSLVNAAIATPYGFEICEDEGDYGKDVVIKADGSTVYKVYFDRVEYAIVFDGNGGTINGEATVTENYLYLSSVTAPADADLYREGYTFAGWSPAVDSEATKAVTYVAQWDVNSYDVTYIANGETFATETYEFGADIDVIDEKPEKKGYSFKAWTDDSGKTYAFPATMPAEDIVVYAKFEAKNFEAKFYDDAESGTAYDITNADFDSAIEAPASEPEKEGYEFGGWSTDGETPLDFENGNVIMTEEGMDFVAVWNAAAQDVPVEYYYMGTDGEYPTTADKTETVASETDATATVVPADEANYTVDEDKSVLEAVVAADGSTVLKVYYKLNTTKLTITVDGEETVIEGLVGSEVPADQLPETDKPGYTFTGWEDENGNAVELPTTMPEGDETYNATYEINVHNVTFVVDGIVYDGPNATTYGEPIAVPSVPTKNGYHFAQWIDADGKQPSDYAGMPDKALEFTAVWTANANVGYVLEIYEMNTDGTYSAAPTMSYTFNDGVVGDDRTVTPAIPTGFILDVESVETPEKSELTGKIPATGTLVLKAYFAREQYTIYVDVDGEITEVIYYYGAAVEDIDDPVKKGYTFTGWDPELPVVMPNEDVTVVAQFEKNSYTATFDAGDGMFDNGESVYTTDVPYAENVTAPADEPEKDGYDFLGWSTDGETVIDNLGKMQEGGNNYIAVWGKAAITVTFYNFLPSEKGPAVPEGQHTYVYDQNDNYRLGDEVVFPADPVIQGHEDNYVFAGWVDADGKAVEEGITVPSEDLEIYAKYDRVKVMLVPKNDDSTTVIDRAGLTVDDYTEDSEWYVYGLEEQLSLKTLLADYIDVQGDGNLVIKKYKDVSQYYGTGSIVEVYDNVTGELVESFRIVIYGDLDGDSVANGVDLSIISEEVLGVEDAGWSVEGLDEYRHYLLKAADLLKDGVVNGQDKTLLNEHVLGVGYINQETAIVEY